MNPSLHVTPTALRGPALGILLIPILLACGADLPRPGYVAQETSALVAVGYPSPPARVEFIPPRPRAGTVWLDGEWAWSGSKWAWTRGRWVVAPPRARFSPWTTVRDERGIVYFAAGVWKDVSGHPIAHPDPLAVGQATVGDVMSPEGDAEKTAPGAHQ